MGNEYEVIWRKGDDKMPDNAKYIARSAQDEMLLRTLNLPQDAVNMVRYYAGKNDKTISEYISFLVLSNI